MEYYKRMKNLTLNFGPQHPAAHGVLSLVLYLEGEFMLDMDTHMGLLHSGTEKLMESKTYVQSIPYFDSLDYVSMMVQEHCFSLAMENLLNCYMPLSAKFMSVLYIELTSILNHLLAMTTHALDMGAMTPFLWGFEESEKMMEFYERVSGARLHANYISPGGVMYDMSNNLLNDINFFINQFMMSLCEIDELLTDNRMWKQSLVGIGMVESKEAMKQGFSGMMLRSTGICWDLSVSNKYEVYNLLEFKMPVGWSGDCYDRYLLRLYEMKESLRIMKQSCKWLLLDNMKEYKMNDMKMMAPMSSVMKYGMESLIHHFKLYSEGFLVNKEETYVTVEAPKGEFGCYMLGDNSSKPYSCSMKAPGFLHLQSLNKMCKGFLLADLVAMMGTLDIVFGEIDS